jgi:hypothetical protein
MVSRTLIRTYVREKNGENTNLAFIHIPKRPLYVVVVLCQPQRQTINHPMQSPDTQKGGSLQRRQLSHPIPYFHTQLSSPFSHEKKMGRMGETRSTKPKR